MLCWYYGLGASYTCTEHVNALMQMQLASLVMLLAMDDTLNIMVNTPTYLA